MLSNQVTIFSGGNGNFPRPCKIKDVPSPSLKSQGVIGINGLAIDSRKLFILFIDVFEFNNVLKVYPHHDKLQNL